MFRMIDKLFCLLVCVPPLYFFGRFVHWYIRQDQEHNEAVTDEESK